MRTIILASSNKHKIEEFKKIFSNDKILSLSDIGYTFEIEETGSSFLENALIKAKTINEFALSKGINASIIADDSGLCTAALNGLPGIYSARYSGTHGNDKSNRDKLLKDLEKENDRSAHFVCCLVEYFSNGDYIHVEGITEGYILKEEKGDTSFGYDCIFFSTDLQKSFGEASSDEKNAVSHRGRAIKKLLEEEKRYLENLGKKKEIYISKTCGLCYGSNAAISKTREILKSNNNVVLYKEILHNKNVVSELQSCGAITKENLKELTNNDYVIIRAHGEPYSTFNYLEKNNIKYLDCTCPNVKAIHHLVKEKDSLGYKIIIIGKHGYDSKPIHPEVFATAGWCTKPILIEEEEEIKSIDLSFEKYFLVVQTTFSADKALFIIDKIEQLLLENDKTFEYKNTICNAQKSINISAAELANKVDAMIVIGGKHSSNSLELYKNVSNITKSFFIENIDELNILLNEGYFANFKKIGITAGASTLKEDIFEIKETLEKKLK